MKTQQQAMASSAGEPPRRRARRARGTGAANAAAAASATLALAWLILLNTPAPSDGFFRPSTRAVKHPSRHNRLSSLPQTRPSPRGTIGSDQQGIVTVPMLPIQRLTRRYSGSPLLMSREDGAETGDEEEEEEGAEGSDGVELPTIEVPEMMSDEVGVCLCVSYLCFSWSCLLACVS